MDAKYIISVVVGIVLGFGLSQLFFPSKSECSHNDRQEIVASNNLVNQLRSESKQALDSKNISEESQQTNEIEQLKAENFQLKMQVVKANQKAKDSELAKRRAVNKGIRAGDVLRMPYSQEEMLAIISRPYAAMAQSMTGESVELFTELYQNSTEKMRDYALEEKIRDFITFHELNIHIELDSVLCKQPVCEVKGKELDVYTWNKVLSAMQKTDWWAFRSSYSTAQYSEGDEYFYSLMSY